MEEVWLSKDHLKMMVNPFVMSHFDYVSVFIQLWPTQARNIQLFRERLSERVHEIRDCAIIIRRGGGLKPEGGALS